ncbi:MAG: hypothetical protein WCF78_04285 [archaeon]
MPLKKPLERRIFTEADVKKITFAKKKKELIRVGKGSAVDVYIGRVHFNEGIIKRVAIRRFKEPISNELANKYKKVIEDLKDIRLGFDEDFPDRNLDAAKLFPKMEILKIKTLENPNGEWVHVTQLFGGTTRGSKFQENNFIRLNAKNVEEISWICANVIEKGYYPGHLFMSLKNKKGVIPIDIDLLAEKQFLKTPDEKAKALINSLRDYAENVIDINTSKNNLFQTMCNQTLEYIDNYELKKIFHDKIKKMSKHE